MVAVTDKNISRIISFSDAVGSGQMSKVIYLEYCPRVKHKSDWERWKLIRPTRNCMYHDRNLPCAGEFDGACHCWSKSGIREYADKHGIEISFGTKAVCVLEHNKTIARKGQKVGEQDIVSEEPTPFVGFVCEEYDCEHHKGGSRWKEK